MYPSKRVWYSIYNNMHPGNRMPSVSMCIVLICSLLLVGYLNTGNNKTTAADANIVESGNTSIASSIQANKQFAEIKGHTSNDDLLGSQQSLHSNNIAGINNSRQTESNNAAANASSYQLSLAATQNRVAATGIAYAVTNNNDQSASPASNSSTEIAGNNQLNTVDDKAKVITGYTVNNDAVAVLSSGINVISINSNPVASEENSGDEMNVAEKTSASTATVLAATKNAPLENSTSADQLAVANEQPETTPNNQTQDKAAANKLTVVTDKSWIENYAMYNRQAPKKWAGKLSRQAYITPSVVYRKLYNNTADKSLSGNGNGNFNNSNVDNAVTQKPSFGLEVGLSYQYDLFKTFKLKAGLQLNYTRYNAHAFENHHPIATSITLNSEDNFTAYEVFRTTPYSNNIGLNPIKLHNETYQFSVPIGADLRLFSTENISWYAGATIQPTFIIYGNTYLISSDRRNYISDKSMLNRFNVNAGFETYLSFKTNGYTWQIGPQFRSQIFSTNNKVYSVEERLMNYGFKIGLTKRL